MTFRPRYTMRLPVALAALLLAVQLPAAAHAAQAAAARAAFAGVLAAVDTCLAATGPAGIDAARLAADGWTEQAIDNVEASPTPNRLFTKDRSGALILFNFDNESRPHCHVMVVRTPEGTEPLADALIAHLGGGFLRGDQGLGAGASAMRVPGRPFILVLRRQADDQNMMADIQIMSTDGL